MKNIKQWQRGFGIVVLAVLGVVSAGAVGAGEPAAVLEAETGTEMIADVGQHGPSEQTESPGVFKGFCSLSCTPCSSHADCPLFEGCMRQCY